MNNIFRSLVFGIVLLLLTPAAKSEPLPLGATIDVHGISIMKKMPTIEREEGIGLFTIALPGQEGTVVSLLVNMPNHSIIQLEDQGSQLTKFVDDKGTDLLQNVSPAGRGIGLFAIPMGQVQVIRTPPLRARSLSKEWMHIECIAPHLPALDTQTITVEGKLVLSCGQGVKTTEHKNIPLDGKGRFETNGMTVSVRKDDGRGSGMRMDNMGKMKMRIFLDVNRPRGTVIGYTFFDTEGNEIESQEGGAVYGPQSHQATIHLAKEVDVLTIRLEAYEKVETVTLPFSLKAGLGL